MSRFSDFFIQTKNKLHCSIYHAEFSKGPFIWSRVPETTLPLSHPGKPNFSVISLKNSANGLHEDRKPVSGGETTRAGELSRLSR